ncbi:alpha/beta hydrolase [Nocardia sp. NPDC050710]|uniref:alpha/beta fold hydrolase n=1 Tax=Nocardia sp. NPDC050710 TaxID=3157220 RepID=UPI00340BEA52
MTARIVLVPGFWLGAWAWEDVVDDLRHRGDEVTAITLPGLDSDDPDRLSVTHEEQAAAIIEAAGDEPVVLVLHSGASTSGYLATDLAPERFERVVYVDTAPAPRGFAVNPDLDPALREWELPAWEEFRASPLDLLAGLDAAALDQFRARAVSEPATIAAVGLKIGDRPERLSIPSTVICCSFSAEQGKQARDGGEFMFAELRRVDADYVDLPTGHWPMWSRPKELAGLIHAIAGS